MKSKTVAIILAGGIGTRFGSTITKQLMSLNGKIVLQYIIDIFKESKMIDEIIIVSNKKDISQIKQKVKNYDLVVEGGESRTFSVKNGLLACPKDTKYVFVHEGVRPFITIEKIKDCLEALKEYKAVGTTQIIADALVQKKNNIVTEWMIRENYTLYQTPEAFEFKTIFNIYKNINKSYISTATPLLEKHIRIKTLEYNTNNLKLTFPQDLFNAEEIMKYKKVIKRIANLKDKHVLLLGASGGIGTALKELLIDQKCTVTYPTRKELNLENCSIENKVFNYKYDCIVHCAGAYARDDEGLLENYDRIMNVNVKSVLFVLENADKMLKTGGNIVIIGSTCASYGRRGISVYSASKSAVNALIEAYHLTLLEQNDIKVNVICPAKVGTSLQTHINPKADLSKMMSPETIAKIILRYCDIDVTGHIVYIKEGLENV
jgi:2-C-methyl-D-erythritol 4-phosphate cytidylyltransferase